MSDANEDLLAALGRVDAAVTAILMLLVRHVTDSDGDQPSSSLEGMLYRAGFTKQTDIVAITGSSRATVSRRLKAEGLT